MNCATTDKTIMNVEFRFDLPINQRYECLLVECAFGILHDSAGVNLRFFQYGNLLQSRRDDMFIATIVLS